MSRITEFKGDTVHKATFFSISFASTAVSGISLARTVLAPAALALVLSHCSPQQDTPAQSAAQAPENEAPVLGLGVDLDNMDRSVRPQDDFFHYVNGGWLEQNPIPSDRSRRGSFDELREAAEQDVLAIVREAATGRVCKTATAPPPITACHRKSWPLWRRVWTGSGI